MKLNFQSFGLLYFLIINNYTNVRGSELINMLKNIDTIVHIYVSSQAGDRLTAKKYVMFSGNKDLSLPVINVDENIRFQKISGFGATFNEAGMICLNTLPSDIQDSILKLLFDEETGAGYTLMKSPLAACDFASAGPWYSYNETPGDTLMSNFSIDRDLGPNGLVSYIKKARKFGRFEIQSPMDFPPDWMMFGLKKGEKYIRPEYYSALARYYADYIKAYTENGITIDYLSLFNEPENDWYSNVTYKAIGEMIKNYIVPQFRSEGLSTKIQVCETANRPEGIKNLPVVLDDPEARKFVSTITVHGYDWDKFSTISVLHDNYPEIPIWMTEVCYAIKSNIPPNGPGKVPVYDYSDGEFWGNMIMNDMKNWVSAWIYWNMILDENGGPWLISKEHGDPDNNNQHPVVIINRKTGEISFTGLYYYLAHFSKFIKPGAYRIHCTGNAEQLNFAGFLNTNGKIILNVINNGAVTKCKFRWKDKMFVYKLEAHSIITFEW